MRLQRTPPATNRRRGIILLVVLVMLTLFAIAGLTFVLYAEASAESARFNKDAESYAVSNAPDMDPNTSLDIFLGQLVYGTKNDVNGSSSALRGHSLAETMYGSYDSLGGVPSDVPYNGTGRLHNGQAALGGQDEYNLVNYMYNKADGFVHDPSRYGSRTDPTQPYAATDQYTGGQNPPYTFPDANSMFLASINQTNGQMVTPSYFRQSVFGSANPSNANWTNAQGKYMTLRPRPADMGPSFPMPDPTTGCDVKNLSGMPGGPDSPWIDVGAPELYTASGLRYKMLVAPLVLDLDRAINLNVVGNVFAENGPTNRHAGDQGIGQWEVNMSRVLSANTTEWQNIFLGGGGLTGRYGPTGLPSNVFPLSGPSPHVYAPADLNGVIDPPNPGQFQVSTPAWQLPAVGGVSCFATFPTQTYGNGGTLETQNSLGQNAHPMFFSPLYPNSPNRLLPLSSHATLMYAGAAASPNSDLVKLCPTNFNASDPNTIKRIYETTLLSMDLDRPGASPYVWDTTNPSYNIFYNPTTGSYINGPNAGDGTPNPPGVTFPLLTSRPGPTPPNSEFDPRTWRSILPATLTRMNLDRQLAPYPASGVQPPDRQQFASDIFTRLLAATGMTGVNANIASATPQQYLSLRWLAQFSANIVDYIDTDDIMTSFQWTTTPQAPDNGWVFGTELPKLVLNEAYLQYNNDPTDPFPKNGNGVKTASKPYQMNVYAELVNPLPSGADLNGSNQATLVNSAGTPLYQIVLTTTNSKLSSYGGTFPTGLRRPEQIVGDPDNGVQPYTTATGVYSNNPSGQVLSVVSSLAAGPQVVTPMGSSANDATHTNQGYYVLGPSSDATVSPVSYRTPTDASFKTTMAYTVNFNDANADNLTTVAPTLLLQRLANPNLPYQPNAGAAGYNPYVTVDYVDASTVAGTVNDARTYNANGILPVPPAVDQRYSYGRTEPYAGVTIGASSQLKQQPHNGTGNGQPSDTFYSQNSPLFGGTGPNHWLVHMDRPLISPIELAGVSAFKPHELTQQFIDVNGTAYGHLAPWTDQNSRLYRLLEFVKVNNPTPGFVNGGRIPGRVNVNTVDPNAAEVFQALCDAESGNNFTNATVGTAFSALVSKRPLLGMAPGAYAATDVQFPNTGLANTLLAAATTWTPGTNPYQQLELLNKLYNNTTTRSNVFAVWLTVGFFQITDDQTQPMKLGPEINLAQGKNIRHHMFAIIDRTQITTFTTKTGGVAAGNNVAINVPTSVADPRTGLTWTIQAGTTLVYDPGQFNEETVVVQAGFTANFTQGHAAGATVISRGNPGPWTPKYDHTLDGGPNGVVPYVVIID